MLDLHYAVPFVSSSHFDYYQRHASKHPFDGNDWITKAPMYRPEWPILVIRLSDKFYCILPSEILVTLSWETNKNAYFWSKFMPVGSTRQCGPVSQNMIVYRSQCLRRTNWTCKFHIDVWDSWQSFCLTLGSLHSIDNHPLPYFCASLTLKARPVFLVVGQRMHFVKDRSIPKRLWEALGSECLMKGLDEQSASLSKLHFISILN